MRKSALLLAAISALGCADDRAQGEPRNGGPVDSGPPPCRLNDSPDLGPGVDGGMACGDVANGIIRETCVGGICHHAGKTPAAHMNLLSPCIADRIVGHRATCADRLIVDPAAPDRSFMIEKLESDKPQCDGESMPYDNHLPPAELECMERWIRAIAAEGADQN